MKLFYPVGLLSGAALIFEAALTRFLAVAQYYHFAFLVVSLALLGFGASGSLLSIYVNLQANPKDPDETHSIWRLYRLCAYGFAGSVVFAYLIVNLLPFDSYSITWDPKQLLYFFFYYLSLTIPFLFVGLGIGGALAHYREKNHQVYAANLAGSALGVLIAPAAMWFAGVPGAILASLLASLLSGVICHEPVQTFLRWGTRLAIFVVLFALVFLGLLNLKGSSPLGMTISPYKGLAQALRIPSSTIIYRRWNAISRIDVVAGGATKVMPGLSYVYPGNPPPQHGLALDADALQPITLIDPGDFEAAAFLPEDIAFRLRRDGKTLVLEPNGGLGLIQAVNASPNSVTAVSFDPLFAEAITATAGEFNIYTDDRVELITSTPRQYLKRTDRRYDVIFLPLTDTYRPVASGAYSLAETYAYTVNSFEDIIAHLSSHGLFVTTRWLQTPPSEEIKLAATALEALENLEIERPSDKLVAFRGIQTLTIVVQPDGWSRDDLMKIHQFCEDLKYDLVWSPDISDDDINRFNRLPEPYYYEAIKHLVESIDHNAYYDSSAYAIEPATDDNPFFFHFFKWQQTPQVLATLGRVWQPFGGSGYLILIALLILVSGLSVVLIGLPYLVQARSTTWKSSLSNKDETGMQPMKKFRVVLYFSSIGLAFLMIEVPLIQRGILLLGHATYSFTVVVLALLLASSIGSLLSKSRKIPLLGSMISLVGLALLTIYLSPRLIALMLGWGLLPKAIGFGVSLFPLGVLMGFPFPGGLDRLAQNDPRLVSWAWGINGCASVIASVIAAILALAYGFNLVLLVGTGFYGFAALILLRK